MENLKNNKLIAEFLGLEKFKDLLATIHNGKINISIDIYEQSKFDTDWNWLMEVVEKILNICLELDSMEMYYSITDSIPDINQSYNEVIEFINWYKGNK